MSFPPLRASGLSAFGFDKSKHNNQPDSNRSSRDRLRPNTSSIRNNSEKDIAKRSKARSDINRQELLRAAKHLECSKRKYGLVRRNSTKRNSISKGEYKTTSIWERNEKRLFPKKNPSASCSGPASARKYSRERAHTNLSTSTGPCSPSSHSLLDEDQKFLPNKFNFVNRIKKHGFFGDKFRSFLEHVIVSMIILIYVVVVLVFREHPAVISSDSQAQDEKVDSKPGSDSEESKPDQHNQGEIIRQNSIFISKVITTLIHLCIGTILLNLALHKLMMLEYSIVEAILGRIYSFAIFMKENFKKFFNFFKKFLKKSRTRTSIPITEEILMTRRNEVFHTRKPRRSSSESKSHSSSSFEENLKQQIMERNNQICIEKYSHIRRGSTFTWFGKANCGDACGTRPRCPRTADGSINEQADTKRRGTKRRSSHMIMESSMSCIVEDVIVSEEDEEEYPQQQMMTTPKIEPMEFSDSYQNFSFS